ncbi:MAG: ubiquitin-activating E1 FCCH domain-containing protein [Brevundimonas sp.]|uniref:ubiquitin-activating E1 FCCH domain-containing protein n=1 Tax=Brevundimonas sp. TaxID=1871086 RepID=UPI002ABB6265|nr:ubiquitin-activating E1 FCCH domain-containing protein [Brevundimonas sp.]MDZ4110168.1 ubiquitin-activating E1 FCCH domain-containing protein [Brevundimonas sp.]
MLFGLSLPVLLMMSFGAVDIHRATTVKTRLQDALDAAALAAARSSAVSDADIQRIGMAALKANFSYPEAVLREGDTTFVLNADQVVIANAKVDVKAIVAHIVLPPYGEFFDEYIPVGSHSEVDRSSKNIEVALVLDTTGSMAGQRITDLIAAARDLVDLVVQDQQTPYYSKVALIPYSMAVNVGSSRASQARGSIQGPTAITNITWYTGSTKSVSGATRANPVVISATSHGFANGDRVAIWGAAGMTQLNGVAFTVTNAGSNSFSLQGVDGRNWGSYSGNGTVAKCARTDCAPTVTSNGHALPNGSYVHILNVGGMTQLNGVSFQVGNATSNTFTLTTVGGRAYTSGGLAYCAWDGCEYHAYFNVFNQLQTQRVSTCVTERSGGNAFTDASPSAASLGRNYPHSSNPCLGNPMVPLSSDRSSLKSSIGGLTASGSTGGHIGVAWGWYALSPSFNNLWPGSAAGEYRNADILKAAVIMTDGEFNSGYCKGVISADSTSGSGSATYHINCNAPNGHPFDQTLALCRAMKTQGVIVYTVGFQVVNDPRAQSLVANCATSPSHVYLPTSGADLRQAFQAIGREITQLRISR